MNLLVVHVYLIYFTDINECIAGIHDCTQGERCINILGSFVCQPHVHCSAGLAPNSATGECEGKEDCLDTTTCCFVHAGIGLIK